MKKLLTVLIIAITLTACSKGGNTAYPRNEPGITPAQTQAEHTEAHSWLIEVNDTKKGVYTIPVINKSLDIEAALYLVAKKNGGDDIFGDYKGSWILTFKSDYKKLSDSDVQYAGNVTLDRFCEDLAFSILPYNRAEYNKIRKTDPNSIPIENLVEMDGMSSFISIFHPFKWENWKASGNGKVYHNENSHYLESESVPVGINILTRQEEVTVDIPTYSSVWKLGYFRGTITKDASDKDPEDLYNDKLSSIAEEKKSETSKTSPDGNKNEIYTTDSEGRKGFDTDGDGKADTWYDEDGNMESDVVKGSIMTDPEGHEGVDTDGDGKLDMWFDGEGNMYTDFDKDGKWEAVEGEYSDGNGE